MNTKVDMLIKKNDEGIYDESIGSDGDYTAAYGYETSIFLSVDCDSSATEQEVADILRRGGWAGNEQSEDTGFEIGSSLWVKYQSKKTQLDKNEAVSKVKAAMNHFVPDRAKGVTVTGNLTTSGIAVNVTILRYNGETDKILFELWDRTESIT